MYLLHFIIQIKVIQTFFKILRVRLKLQICIYFPTLGQAKDEVDGWLEKGSLASGWPSSSVRRTNATVHTRHHMAVKVNNFSKNSNILYLDWWEVRGCSKCCLPACLMADRPSSSFFDEQIITQSREKFSFIFPRKKKSPFKLRLVHWRGFENIRYFFLYYLSTIKNYFEFERSTFPIFKSKWPLNQQ